jgi:hypothetical protein
MLHDPMVKSMGLRVYTALRLEIRRNSPKADGLQVCQIGQFQHNLMTKHKQEAYAWKMVDFCIEGLLDESPSDEGI